MSGSKQPIRPLSLDGIVPSLIAIDGPAASGKSTVGHMLARQLGYLYFDTGVMYRAVAWAALDRKLSVADEDAVGLLAETLAIEVSPAAPGQSDGRHSTVTVDGQDVTWLLRSPEVDRTVSAVAANAQVRAALTAQQRRIGLRYRVRQRWTQDQGQIGIVMVGRDVGTVVLPEAPLKIFLDAPVAERARRRYAELAARGQVLDFEQVLADLRRRDQIDSERPIAPLRIAEDAVVLDTTTLSPEQVVAKILNMLEQDHDHTLSVC